MISQELRDLRKTSVASFAPSCVAPDELQDGKIKTALTSGRRHLIENTQTISLRRDGQVPLRFSGSLVFETIGQWTDGEIGFDHTLAFYRDSADEFIAVLTLCPKEGAALRPYYWAQVISDVQTLEKLLERWCREVLISTITADFTASLQDARSALHFMTTHLLRVAKPQKERKEPCLQ